MTQAATRSVMVVDTEKRTITFLKRPGEDGLFKETFTFEQALQQEILTQGELDKWQRGDYENMSQEEIDAWLDEGKRP